MSTSTAIPVDAAEAAVRQLWRVAPLRLLLRGCLSLLAAALVTVPILVAFKLHLDGLRVSPQYTTNTIVPAGQLARWRSEGSALLSYAPPVVIAYSDIRVPRSAGPHSPGVGADTGDYAVTPQQLDEQLTALQAAGYRTLSVSQFVGYMRGGPIPHRSVLLTFDSPGQGLWTFADRILARHHMRGIAFIGGQAVGSHWGRYLSWSEIDKMLSARRWSFEPELTVGSETAAAGLTAAEWFRDEALPEPRLVALARSASGQLVRAGAATHRAVASTPSLPAPFVASFASGGKDLSPTALPGIGGRPIGRIDVTGDTGPSQLLARVVSDTGIPIPAGPLLANSSRWVTSGGAVVGISGRGPELRLTGTGRYEYAAYAPIASASWDNYRVDTTIQGLSAQGVSYGALFVRVGSDHVLALKVSARSATLVEHSHGSTVLRGHWSLFPSAAHDVRIMVRGQVTTIGIDHAITFNALVPRTGLVIGGIALAGARTNERSPWPMFAGTIVRPIAVKGATVLPPIHLSAHVPLADSRFWIGPSTSARSVAVSATRGVRFTGTGTYGFAEFAPAQTAGWVGYRITATAMNLPPVGSVEVYGRLASRSQVRVVVGRHWVRVFAGGSRIPVASRPVPDAPRHTISVRVLANRTVVHVDSLLIASVRAVRGSTGGVALGFRRRPGEPWPRAMGVTVLPVG